MKNSLAVDRLRFLVRQAEQLSGQYSSVVLNLGDAKALLSELLEYEGQKTIFMGRNHNAGLE